MEDETTLEQQISEYEAQLSQLELALGISDESAKEDLKNLCTDLKQLITLTKESLLSIKKKRLLCEVELLEQTTPSGDSNHSNSESRTEVESSSAVKETNEKKDADLEQLLNSLEGTRCQAPFGHSWGQVGYHNALILSVESNEDLTSVDDVMVRVLFCNPNSEPMKPCLHFMNGNCRNADDDCRFSHGHVIPLQSLRQFVNPDYSLLQRDAPCSAKYTDGLWYPAIVESVDDDSHKVTIRFKQYGNLATVDLEDVIPHELESGSESSDDEYADDLLCCSNVEEVGGQNDDDFRPTTVWVSTTPTSQALGEWERHTKGIGSKLMAQMGYVLGQGLGKHGKGRLEPIEAVILPPGKSLDKVMELKEKAENRNLIKVEKKLRRKQQKEEKSIAAGYKYEKKASVFDFINKKLGNESQNVSSSSAGSFEGGHLITKPERAPNNKKILKSASVKHLNTQAFKVSEDIRKTEQELSRLQTALARNATKDRVVAMQLKEKIDQQERNLKQLKAFEKDIHGEQNLRKNDKKLSIF